MKNIIITGGGSGNKGAQAMTFIAVSELKKRFPEHRIYLLSESDNDQIKPEGENYCFEYIGWYPLKFARCQSRPILRILCYLRNKKELLEAEDIYKNTDLMIDVSGYALGSNWSIENCNNYLDHIQFAKAFNIPVYIMPQSFGPFDFIGENGKKINQRIEKLLPTVKVICAREEEGYLALREKYHLDNVIRADDLVINNRKINIEAIYKEVPKKILPSIQAGSTAVIPNQRNFDIGKPQEIEQIYVGFIQELLLVCPAVYLISHSVLDKEICRKLKYYFKNDNRVILLEEELDCIEFNQLVQGFRFVVASRFHSIVHAFKNGIPCIVLGWATKYHNLAQQFGQEKYMMDVREKFGEGEIKKMVRLMSKEWNQESQIIRSNLAKLQENNVFDIIQE